MVNLNNRRKLTSFPICPSLHCLPDSVYCTLKRKGRSENSLNKRPSYRFEPRGRKIERRKEKRKESGVKRNKLFVSEKQKNGMSMNTSKQ